MRITAKFLQARVDTVNRMLGFDPDTAKWNTIGAIHLYQAYGGYAIHRVVNESGGVSDLSGGCDTGAKAAEFLGGMIAMARILEDPTRY